MSAMKNTIVFYLSQSKELALKIAAKLDAPVGKVQITHFSDGELIVRCLSDVENKNVVVVQSTGKPSNQSLFELELFADAVKTMGAKKVAAVIPYYGYSRQDRISYYGEPVSAKVVAKVLETVGFDEVYSVDLHTIEIEKYFGIKIFNLKPFKEYAKYFKDKVQAKDLVVITPDHGSDDRAIALGEYFPGCTMGFFKKRRPKPNQSEILSFEGDVEGKTCLIVDDIVDTCGTINNAIKVLKEKKAKDIYVVGTHAVFSTDRRVEGAKEVVVSDSLEKKLDGVTTISLASLIADAIAKNI